jgi:bacteriophage N4 adsorption protein B
MTVILLYELILFAAIGFAIGGIDDLIVDMLWITRTVWRRMTVYSRHQRVSIATLARPRDPAALAVIIPAWDEASVIAPMLRNATSAWIDQSCTIYVGCYWNDIRTQAAVASVRDDRIRLVIVPHNGPTTKSDCLNHIWHQLRADEMLWGVKFKAVVLHDAEDVVHRDELILFSSLIDRFALVQIPVRPLIDAASPWISGHYADEFAESHTKALVVREAIGAAVPAAGVGCAISREALNWLSAEHRGRPFGENSLTEDYELGLRIRRRGFRGVFVRMMDSTGTDMVAVHAHFPDEISASVNQKTRWILGIALAGWDRMGWDGGPQEVWMRLRDRRPVFAAVVIAAGYLAAVMMALLWIVAWPLPHFGPWVSALLWFNGMLLLWRMILRFGFTTASYGWREGVRSVPRMVVSNTIGVMAAVRAVGQYVRHYRTGKMVWAKTSHKFPDIRA